MIVNRRNGAVLRQLQTLFNVGTIGDLTDGQLLERFATDAGEIAELAFAALVERQQAMVWRVCLAILRDEHLAEDAARPRFWCWCARARSLWVRDSLGPWLHQVALPYGVLFAASVIRRRKHERRSAENLAGRLVQFETMRDLEHDAALHDEVNRLPEKYLCCWCSATWTAGRTRRRRGSWAGRSGPSRAGSRRDGDSCATAWCSADWGSAAAGAAVESMTQAGFPGTMPRQVSESIAHAAMGLTARGLPATGASARVLSLTQGVLRAMLWGRLRVVAAAVIAIGIASGGAFVYAGGAQEPAKKDAPSVSKPTTAPAAQAPKPKVQDQATAETAAAATALATLKAQQFATRKANSDMRWPS